MNSPTQFNPADVSFVPARRLKPKVKLLDEQKEPFSGSRDQRRLSAHFSRLTDTQAELLKEVLAELPGVLKSIKDEALVRTRQSIKQAFTLPEPVIRGYIAEAWAHERWHESFLQQTPCVTLAEAGERCAHTPWDALEDLLALSHQGSRQFPQFLFSAGGAPDPWWVAVLAALRCEERPDEWKLLAWLLKPHSILQHRSPLEALRENPEQVISLAKYATREDQV